MGARQSKRSVDITTTPKKEGLPAEGGVVGDAAAPGDGKLERIEEADTKPTTNGIAPHTEVAEDKEKDKDEATEKDKEQVQEEVKAEETKQEATGESPTEVAEVTTPTEATPASPNAVASPDSKEAKKKDKKKKWSFRSISFSKKDKTKPSREETRKNGDVTMDGNMSVQEPLAEGGEEAESATATASSPVEEKSAASSPSADEQVAAPVAAAAASTTEPKEEVVAAASPAAAAAAAAASPAEEKKEEPTPSAPTPVPSVEDKKEEAVEKVEAAEKKVVEVSPAAVGRSIADPVEVPVFRVQLVATPSIIERETSEDLPPPIPSSPPPTPIDPSPLQQARQAAASATALAEALKLPAEAADREDTTTKPHDAVSSSREDVPQESRVEPIPASASLKSPGPSADLPSSTDATLVPAKIERPPAVEDEIESRDVAKVGETLASIRDNERAEIDPKVESVSESPVVSEEAYKRQKGETDRAEGAPSMTECDMTERLSVSLDGKNTQSEVENNLIFKETDRFISGNVNACPSSEVQSVATPPIIKKETNKNYPSQIPSISPCESLPTIEPQRLEVARVEEVMNETLPVVECQIKSEINSGEGAMKTNVSPNVGHNEKVEVGTSAEIVMNSARPAIKQRFSESENLETEKVESLSDVTTQRVESIEKLSGADPPSFERSGKTEMSKIDPTSSAEMVESPLKKLKLSSEDVEVAEQLCERPIKSEHDYAKDMPKEAKEETIASVISSARTEPAVISNTNEMFIDSEEGPVSVSDDIILVEAKLAMIIPEDDSVEELTDTTDSVKVIPETDEEKIENEPESDSALPTEETLISEELEDISVPEDAPIVELCEPCEPLSDTKTIYVEDSLPPPPFQDAALFSSQASGLPSNVNAIETETMIKEEPLVVFSTTIEAEPVVMSAPRTEQTEGIERSPFRATSPGESCPLDDSASIHRSECSDAPTYFPSVQADTSQSSEPQARLSPINLIPISEDMLSFDCPLRSPKMSSYEPPIPAEHAASPKDPTETLLAPSTSPNLQSSSNASGIATATKDCPQTLSHDVDDRSDRESKTTGSVSLSEPTSRDHSDVELKERLAAECLAKTECQEGALCQLSFATLSTAAQEHHQSAPETEAPVENNVAHDAGTTESLDEPPKVAPPAVPTEVPASPPTAPAITEDVASVTKAIEEIDISDKAVAAAVNECNTNEIIADAHHQNNINEYE